MAGAGGCCFSCGLHSALNARQLLLTVTIDCNRNSILSAHERSAAAAMADTGGCGAPCAPALAPSDRRPCALRAAPLKKAVRVQSRCNQKASSLQSTCELAGRSIVARVHRAKLHCRDRNALTVRARCTQDALHISTQSAAEMRSQCSQDAISLHQDALKMHRLQITCLWPRRVPSLASQLVDQVPLRAPADRLVVLCGVTLARPASAASIGQRRRGIQRARAAWQAS